MAKKDYENLSKRERQIMNVLHQLGEGSVGAVLERLTDPSGYNSIRKLMNILEEKGLLQHRKEKNKYIYFPTVKKEVAKKSALKLLVETYFDRSVPSIVSTLLADKKLTAKDLDEISDMIAAAKRKKRKK